jgi:hypothetical protein
MSLIKDLDHAKFPVSLRDVYHSVVRRTNDIISNDHHFKNIFRFKAIVADDDETVFAVVTDNYRLITNQEAIEIGSKCFKQIFDAVETKDMILHNVIMPHTRSYCHLDYLHSGKMIGVFKNDVWNPFIRISNSYNRTYALKFNLGFCRGICKNGVIFGEKNIIFKYIHTKLEKEPEVQFKLRAGEFKIFQARFIAALQNIKRYHVPPDVMWALACKAFKWYLPNDLTKNQLESLNEREHRIIHLTEKYFSQLGHNGYAAMNVLTEFASFPEGFPTPMSHIDSLQKKAGAWIMDFVESIKDEGFTFEKYLGEYGILFK